MDTYGAKGANAKVIRLLVLGGDGIGPEVTVEALRVLALAGEHGGIRFEAVEAPFGGASIDACGVPVSDEVLELAASQDAVLLGAVGGPKWDDLPAEKRAEKGLLKLRARLAVYANLRPAKAFASLVDSSPLRADRIGEADFVVVRELVGGLYFGTPRGIEMDATGRRGFNTMVYGEAEVRRLGRVAFELARSRKKRLCSVDKANVLEVSALWRQVMGELGREYPDVTLSHLYVDNAAMQMVRNPGWFDVIATENLFGDILSDIGGALTGSLGMLPSASLGDGPALYEPVHGSAPDIAGKGLANPLGAILSAGMLLEHTAGRPDLRKAVDAAVEAALEQGLRTADLIGPQGRLTVAGTGTMAAGVLRHLANLLSNNEIGS